MSNNDDYLKMLEEMQKQAFAMQEEMMKNLNPDVLAEIQSQAIEQMQAMTPDMMAQLQADAFNMLTGDDDEISEEELAQFLSEHPVPAGCEKYLPIGAVLIGMNGEPIETLAMLGDADDWKEALEDGWGIDDRESGINKIEWLLAGGHAETYNEDFIHLQNGEEHSLDEDDVETYEACIEGLVDVLELDAALVNGCRNLAGWDLERVGYLARIFVHVGYITEAEAWEYFARAAAAIGAQFASWEEYFISIIFGRSFSMGLSEGVFAMTMELLNDSRDYLDAHPITALK